jgi:hypothetical protein
MIVNPSSLIRIRSPFVFDDYPLLRLIQWNPSPAPAGQPLSDDSSESDGHSPVPYGELDALRFEGELEVTQRELEEVSKKAGIAKLEWEDQCTQLLGTSTVRPRRRSLIQSGL